MTTLSDVFSNPGYNFTPTTGFPFPVFVGLFIQTIQEIDEVNQVSFFSVLM